MVQLLIKKTGGYFKSPLFIFLIISIGILIIDNTLFYDRQSNKVVVSQDNLRKFVNVQYGLDNADMINQYINTLDEDKKELLISEYITNEALYNFAINRSLDKNDEELKSIITAKSKNIIEMMVNAEKPLPSINEAKRFFEDGTHNYHKSETYDLVLVNKKNNNPNLSEILSKEPLSLRQLVGMSDVVNFEKIFRNADPDRLISSFGEIQSAAILDQKDGTWSGPYTTDKGYHWIRKETIPATSPDFETIKDQVISDLYQQRIDERYQVLIQELIGQLRVKSDV
ncbi:peptidylprolyl isomerase [Vibrio superstes]|uniref:PpiC domain-containing protein n=1 Tax=Vibrio superstes NBRC 103154 TaxID=1219062 RepID=A0A511QT20_9VIBR|nr:peptidylprolyl isomerase [Vibrio superstes]GEM80471.1 hypothetical protein VSU01S_27160 [Vibrio superstes NBRC 103154]